jgi:hypothetical protein
MARSVWHDQPDYYTTATLARFWTEAHADAQVIAGEGYLGGAALTGATADAFVMTLSTGLSGSVEFGLGHRIKIDALPAAEKILLGITTTSGADLHVCLTLRTDGKVSVWRGDLADELATSADALETGTQLRLGMTGILDEANGTVEVWLDRDPIVRINGVSTVAGTPSTWGGVYVGLAPDIFQSHLYAQAGYADLRPGYVVRVCRPIEPALYTGYAPVGAATIPAAIDDPTPDDDTTYISAPALDRRYCVLHDPITDERILGTRMVALVRNVSGTSPTFAPLIRNVDGEGVDVDPWRSVVSTAWRAIDRWDQRNPFTDAPWTAAEVTGCGWGGETDL